MMFNLKNVFLGYADAATEAERCPQEFFDSFFDPNNYIDQLIDGDKYLLRGRKGDGKTAFGEQLKLLSKTRSYSFWRQSLAGFNNTTFSQIKTYDRCGGNPYISFWNCILMIELVKMIDSLYPNIQVEDFVDLIYCLNEKGFLNKEDDLSITVRKLVETDSELNLKSAFKHSKKYNYDITLKGADQIADSIKTRIQNLYIDKKFIFVIDGIDDVLSSSEFKPEIITGLIRAVDATNTLFSKQSKTALKVKIIILIRDDIFNMCCDPNLNKISRDSGIRLSWNISAEEPFKSDLMKLVGKRFDLVSKSEMTLETVWSELFPETIGAKDSLEYILDNIIYRPRDILQLFTEFQKEFIVGKKLTLDKIKKALERYSDEYFVDSMKDELVGFFPNDVIYKLPNILTQMGLRFFHLSDFEKICKQHKEFESVSSSDVLKKLFEDGYIGQHRPREKMEFTVFSYRNPREHYIEEHECIVHRGLTRALTL